MLWISVLTMSLQLRLSADEISFEYSISLSIPALSSTNRNVFSTLEEALPNAEKLEKLIIRNKNIYTLSTEIRKFTNLILLDLSNNKLSSIPKEISNLKKLKYIIVSNNNFHNFPEILAAMPGLELIDLSNNYLNELPSNFNLNNRIKYLDL